ncbi:MAG: AEC family transporter [Puniceicoccales bacterium]
MLVGMGHAFNTLFPVFAIIGLGYLLAVRGFLTQGFLSELNRFLFWVSLPCLIVFTLAEAPGFPEETVKVFLVFSLSTFLLVGISILTTKLLKLPLQRKGTFIQAAFRGNLAFAGLPILLYATRNDPASETVLAQAIFVFAPTMILYNVLSVFFLEASRTGQVRGNLLSISKKVATNPLILAAIAGVILYLLPGSLPTPVLDSLELVAQISAPGALLCVGGGMAAVSLEGRYRSALFATALKVAVLPLLSLLLSLIFQLNSHSLLILLVLSSCPTAVASYVMAKEMGGDEALASGAIVLSTLLCVPSLAMILASV